MFDWLDRRQSLHVRVKTPEFGYDRAEDLEYNAAASTVMHADSVTHEDKEWFDYR